MAHLRSTKGYPDLLQAARLVAEADDAVRFVAAGHGPQDTQLERLRDNLGLGDRFRFLGYREDALGLMSALDVFVLASHHEGRPVALMEAMAIGVPSVATRVGGVPDMLDDGRAGLLTSAGQPEELAAALQELTGDPARRAALGHAARQRAETFSAGVAVAQVERVYRRVSSLQPR